MNNDLDLKLGRTRPYIFNSRICPILGQILAKWALCLTGPEQERFIAPLEKAVMGSKNSHKSSEARAWMARDWIVRSYLPAWLRAVGEDNLASEFGGSMKIISDNELEMIFDLVNRARYALYNKIRTGGVCRPERTLESAEFTWWHQVVEGPTGAFGVDFSSTRPLGFVTTDAAMGAAFYAGLIVKNSNEERLAETVGLVQGLTFQLLQQMLQLEEDKG